MNANHILQLSGILQQNLGLIPHEIQLKNEWRSYPRKLASSI